MYAARIFPISVPHKFVNRSNFTFHINLWAFDFNKSQMRYHTKKGAEDSEKEKRDNEGCDQLTSANKISKFE